MVSPSQPDQAPPPPDAADQAPEDAATRLWHAFVAAPRPVMLLAPLLLLLGVCCLTLGKYGFDGLVNENLLPESVFGEFKYSPSGQNLDGFVLFIALVGAALVAQCKSAWRRHRGVLVLLRVSAGVSALAWLILLCLLWYLPGRYAEIDPEAFTSGMRNQFLRTWAILWLPPAILHAMLLAWLWRSPVVAYYLRRHPEQTDGQAMVDLLCLELSYIHTKVGWLFGLICRAMGWLLRPVPWSARLLLLLLAIGVGCLAFGRWGADLLYNENDLTGLIVDGLGGLATRLAIQQFANGVTYLGWATVALGVLALLRHWGALLVLRIGAITSAFAWLGLLGVLWWLPTHYAAMDPEFSDAWIKQYWVLWTWAWLPFGVLHVVLLISLWRSSLITHYTGKAVDAPTVGDRTYENIRTHGKDPRYRTSAYWPIVTIIFIISGPYLLRGCGLMEEPYEIPYGSGSPKVQVVEVKRVKRKKPEKLVLNMDSSIIFYRPKLEDIKILDEVLEETEVEYVADRSTKKMGRGDGDQGGWPDGVKNARIRFIRLKYAGGDWDQDMGRGADYNLLLKLRDFTGFRIAANTEAKEIRALRRFPKGKAPPFVFMTGSKGISLSSAEVAALRWYCLQEGGMIFADNGGGGFHGSFGTLCRKVFGKSLKDIADDDPIFQEPYLFPNGAPPLWHHAGTRALGIRHEGRLVVFYHPGDINDAWKTGHSGASKTLAMRAYRMGVNVVYYSFTRYLAKHHKR